ncbi:sugar ABC transporter ATP-binding protein [Arthrobacter bambusae]|uniref:sugar ABC transporter ATP-binding protein n=1 Tax=Arthrobacter bambusae TaxID=1338426 RepID=UPI002784AE7E|nr:sugar ABC transporter ATP-binding protein [Arthrobacter bambusae]MDQ0212991.1 ABC-type sugar transport system ATPase subunit [Arthrobacter bambusae]MDQ0237297.1 ABC-type sugar transport system ATPase subunit [Arthrobacter bambusae]
MLVVRNATKSYGATQALRGVSFSAERGEIFAVLGENGAGKSTLLRILAGATRPDSGILNLDGQDLKIKSPREALQNGMVLIPQELAYVPGLSVAENIMLGQRPTRRGLITQRSLRSRAEPFARQLGVEGSLDRPMSSLSLAEAQLVEIAKGLARNARVMLLDEPTATLSQPETERLFTTLNDLRRKNIVMIYISHRLDEVMGHCDRVMVMRDGSVSLTGAVRDFTKRQLITSMLGNNDAYSSTQTTSRTAPSATPFLTLSGLGHSGSSEMSDVSLDVRSGEVLGVYGVRGGGQEALLECLAGLRPHTTGSITMSGIDVPPLKSVRQSRHLGISYIPPDRKKNGLILDASISANLSLPQLGQVSRAGLISVQRERVLLKRTATAMKLKYRAGSQRVRELSGGNQQKVLVGSRLAGAPKLLAVQEPTRGVDIGARREIHELLAQLAAIGTAVVVATTDIEEAVELPDRLAVVRGGKIVALLQGQDKTQERALLEAVGGSHD